MEKISSKIVQHALQVLLYPVIRFCLRNSLTFQHLIESAKIIFVRAGAEELEKGAQQATTSRISLMTGINRRDVARFKTGQVQVDKNKGLAERVIGQWRTNRRFLGKGGEPRVLSLGANSEFVELVRSVSHDLRPASVLFELKRIAAVEVVGKTARLRAESYVPKGDVVTILNIFGRELDDLICAVEENLFTNPKLPNHHLRAEYDKIREHMSDELKVWFLKEANAFQIRVRDHLAQFDQDSNPDPNYTGNFIRVVFGTFSRIDKGNV